MGQGGGNAVACSFEQFLTCPLLASLGGAEPLGVLLAQADGGLASAIASQIWKIGLVVLGIGLVIFVHELGHFLAAKWCGVKVEKFYVGFDFPISIGPIKLPRTLGKFRYGETEYGIGTIPLGGYVKMLGQDDDPRKMEEEAKRIRLAESGVDAADDPTEPTDASGQSALDPRSYPAKSVWQRMIIISSGVVMNLITGVMFATAAFMYGVPYVPAVVGDVSPGGPAYRAGIEPGGKVISVGGIEQDDNLYFSDMATAIVLEGTANPEEAVRVAIEYPDGVRNYSLKTAEVAAIPGLRRIGISNLPTTFLRDNPEQISSRGSLAAGILRPEDAGAEVISVDGTAVPGAGERDNVAGSVWLQRTLIRRSGHPVTLGLKRKDGTTREVVLPPQPLLLPGIGFLAGPVIALVSGGPADKAGVQVGDQIVAIDGDAQIDAFALSGRLAERTGAVKLTVKRPQGEQFEQLELEVPLGELVRTSGPSTPLDNTVSIDRLGLAVTAVPEVAFVRGDAAVAAAQPFRVGDQIKKVAVRWTDGEIPEILADDVTKPLRTRLAEGFEFNAENTLSSLVDLWQYFPEGTGLRVTLMRDGQIVEVDAELRNSGEFWHDRGLGFAELQRTHVAAGIVPAVKLGLEASKRKFKEVFRFLGLLVSGKAGADMVGGPITIFRVAGQETSRGVPALLMFLTMLSMNLAILNFLPIPALDGGHMVFLTAEAVLGRPVNERLQMQLTMAGVLAILSLMVFALFNDIRRL